MESEPAEWRAPVANRLGGNTLGIRTSSLRMDKKLKEFIDRLRRRLGSRRGQAVTA